MKKNTLLIPVFFLMILLSSCQKDNKAAAPAASDVKTKSVAFAADSLRNLNNPINNGLVGYYPFSGNANDASGYGNNGTLTDFDDQFISYGFPTLTAEKYGPPNSAYHFN